MQRFYANGAAVFGGFIVVGMVACSLANTPSEPGQAQLHGTGGSSQGGTGPGGGGDGGTGGAACSPQACPGVDTTCALRACVNGSCAMVNTTATTPCSDNGGSECDGNGRCVALDGAPCTDPNVVCRSGNCADGFCCGTACGGTCEGCSSVPGTCTPHAAGSDPETECGVGSFCNGASGCFSPLGAACGGAGECASGNCVDGVCCDSPCNGVCQSCVGANTGGVDGACGFIGAGLDPDGECATSCNGSGACGCPPRSNNEIAGPIQAYGFCWYLTQPGVNCDAACAAQPGGQNLALSAQNAWPDSCGGATAADVSTMFRNQGNPGGWTTTGGTGYHTLGYGYAGDLYYGKCVSGGVTGNGSFPNDANTSPTRHVICPCFAQ